MIKNQDLEDIRKENLNASDGNQLILRRENIMGYKNDWRHIEQSINVLKNKYNFKGLYHYMKIYD